MGIYKHYKGPLYQVIGLAHDANASEFYYQGFDEMFPDGRTCVIYIPLQLDGAHLGPRMAVRTLDDFMSGAPDPAWVGEERFKYLGPELTAEMLP